jgi:NADH-quinone oxidoreductase subunit H
MQAITSNPLFLPILLTIVIILAFPLVAGYLVLVERKVLADIQVRLGPMRVGPHGFLQPIADAVKLLIKEDIIPEDADRMIFWMAPCISCFTALSCFTVLPFTDVIRVADVNVGLLIVSAMSAIGVFGIILGGWSSNSHYSLLGGLRSAAQLVSYEVALAIAALSAVMAAGSLSMVQIVRAQETRHVWFAFDNFGFMLVPFAVYIISSIAETNRVPFDLPEAESELVAGYHTEYSGFRWALYMLSEYAAVFVMGAVVVTLFLGGWLRPFPSVGWLELPMNYGVPVVLFVGSGLLCLPMMRRLKVGWHRAFLLVLAATLVFCGLIFLVPVINQAVSALFWFLFKVGVVIYALIWVRGTFPRFRYDQLMNIGWKYMIPIALGCVLVNAIIGIARP